MKIELTEIQKEAIKLIVKSGHDEKELIRHFINIGILFHGAPFALKKVIMNLLQPESYPRKKGH